MTAGRAMSSATEPKVTSLGCRLNAAEGEAMKKLARDAGLHDAVIINSCAVTNEAVRQSRQATRRAQRENDPEENKRAPVIVTGCAAQIDPEAFSALNPTAVLGNTEKLDPAVWRRLANSHRGAHHEQPEAPTVVVNDIMSVKENASYFVDGFGDKSRGFLQVQNGCDHRCTFCIIPYGRGNARSASVEDVVEQAQRLTQGGYRELVLTGVDLTSWGTDLPGEPKLGRLVHAILMGAPLLKRLRLSSVDGVEIDPHLFDLLCGEERLAPYLHLSVQAGDDMILKRMKRRHHRQDIIDLCHALRERRPDMAFGADLIAGFPTETEEMFENTRRLITDAGLSFLHVFPFSPRDGAPAARMPQLAKSIVKERAARLREEGAAALSAFLAQQVGRTAMGVVEAGGRVRLDNFCLVHLHNNKLTDDHYPAASRSSPLEPGAEARVAITGAKPDHLEGVVIGA